MTSVQPPPPPTQQQQVPPPPVPQPSSSIEVDHVSKWFGDVVAVSDVSFRVQPGVTALLGPNGAGKSTMLRMLCGLTVPAQGSVRVLGVDPRSDRSVRRQIGLVPQQESLFAEQRAIEFVSLAARLHGVEGPDAAARSALAIVEMDPDDTRPVRTYSKGMRQRVKVAQAIVHDPHLLLMDEPLTGLDPRQRLHMIELIRSLGASGHCVVVSSHVLDEVERLGSRVLVIAQGRLAAEGDFREIRELMDDRPHRIRLEVGDARQVGGALLTDAAVLGLTIDSPTQLTIETNEVAQFRANIARVTRDLDIALRAVTPLDDDLESVFRYLVGR